MFGSIGPSEILLILLIVLLLFGAKRIPEIMRGIGEGLREFRKAASEATSEIKRAVDETEPAVKNEENKHAPS